MVSEHRQIGIDRRYKQADVVAFDDLDDVGDIGRVVGRAQPDRLICEIEGGGERIDISSIGSSATRPHLVDERADERRPPARGSEKDIRRRGHRTGPD